MEAAYNKEGRINWPAYDWYLGRMGFEDPDDSYEIPFGTTYDTVDLYIGGDKVDRDQNLTTIYHFRIFYYGSPVNGISLSIDSESFR